MMISEPTSTALLYSGGMLTDLHGKTSHGLLRYSKRFQILGVVDHKHAGQMSNEIVSNCQDDVPIFSDINKAIEGLGKKPDFLLIDQAILTFSKDYCRDEKRSITKKSIIFFGKSQSKSV